MDKHITDTEHAQVNILEKGKTEIVCQFPYIEHNL
jgi:hypothetical protein